jgi:ADP-heptose:LPS heptosyltransferase
MNAHKRHVLLLRLDAIGDFVLFAACLPHLRALLPDAMITLVVDSRVGALAEQCVFVDRVMAVDSARCEKDVAYLHTVDAELRNGVDIAINTMYTRTAISDNLIARTHAPVKIGYECIDNDQERARRTKDQVLYTHLIRTDQEWMFELDRHACLLRELGADLRTDELHPQYWIKESDRTSAKLVLLEGRDQARKWVAVCPGAGFGIKLWSAQSFAMVADQIAERYHLDVIFLGAAHEKSLVNGIRGLMRSQSFDLVGKLSLSQFASVLEEAALYVGVDTAGFHFSWSRGIPTVGIFGGGHFGRFNPTLPHVRVVHKSMDCYNCYWRCIYPEALCITEITPSMVLDAVHEVLSR